MFTERVGQLIFLIIPVMITVGVVNAIGRAIGAVIGRTLVSNSLLETQWYAFSLVFLLGAGYALKHSEHVRVDVFYSTWSPKRKALIDFLGSVLFLIPFSLIIIIVSIPWVSNSWAIFEMSGDPGGLPRYPIKTMVIVCFVLLIIQGISEAIKNLAILTGAKDQLEEGRHGTDATV